MSVLALEGMEFYAYHGYYHREQKIGGYYKVDVYLETDFSAAAETDKLDGTIDYELIYAICEEVMQNPVKLIEHLCQKLVTTIKSKTDGLDKLRVRVSKLAPPIEGKVARSYVEMEEIVSTK